MTHNTGTGNGTDTANDPIPPSMAGFVHLHVHSHYSFLDGGVSVESLVKRAADFNMPAVAITDHGNMCGAMDLYQACLDLKPKDGPWKVKPIFGTEAYICDTLARKQRDETHHLLILAADPAGYKNLIKLNSFAHRDGFYIKPRIDFDLLAQYNAGLIVTSACLAGELAQAAVAGHLDESERIAKKYLEVFGDRYYLEVQAHGIADEDRAAQAVLKLVERLKVPFICTNDSHYLDRQDAHAHDALLCMCTGSKMSDPNRLRFDTEEFYFKSQAEMLDTFRPEFHAGLFRTQELAERCNVPLKFGEYFLPKFKDIPAGMSDQDYLRHLAEEGLSKRYKTVSDALRERLTLELDVINFMGFASYFLIVADFINWAKNHDIAVGPGRGSAAGSLVAYALRITDVDPIKYDLLFERFLNKERISMPDIDIDFDPDGREQVIDYVRQKYGEDCVCQIITYSGLKAKAVVRDLGRVMDIPLAEVDKLAKLIPEGPNVTLASAFADEAKLREAESTNQRYRDLFDVARRLEGLNRHPGIHAAGVIIAPGPLHDYIPLYRNKEGADGRPVITTQFSMEYCEKLGLLKMDFLGLRNLSIIKRAVALIQKSRGFAINWDTVDLQDRKTYELLQRGDAMGVFQLESDGMRKLLQRMKPDCFEDLIALIALYRPGPLDAGMVDQYVAVKHKQKPLQSFHASIDDILRETNGVILYQEQVMLIASRMAGFSLSEADNLRKAMGKKLPEVMQKFKTKFVDGAVKNGVPEKTAAEIFELMVFFAGYGFNKSHSTAYAVITFQTAYLKANFPVEYQAALMTCEMGAQEKLVEYIEDSKRLGIVVHGPDIQVGESFFSVVPANTPKQMFEDGAPKRDREIVFGLAGIKGVGESAIDTIAQERARRGPFRSLVDFAERLDPKMVNSKVLEALVKAGAFDRLLRQDLADASDPARFAKAVRPRLLAGLESVLQIAQQKARERKAGQKSLFATSGANDSDDAANIRKLIEGLLPKVGAWSDPDLLAAEKETLGFYFTSHPLARYSAVLQEFATHDASTVTSAIGGKVIIAGVVQGFRETTIKQGKNQGRKMASWTLEDLTGAVPCVCFPDAFEKNADRLIEVNGQVLVVMGRADVREEKLQIIVDRVVPADLAREELTAMVTLLLRAESVNDLLIQKLQKVFQANRGDVPVRMHVVSGLGRVIVNTGPRWRVRPSAHFAEAVQIVLGPNSVSFHS